MSDKETIEESFNFTVEGPADLAAKSLGDFAPSETERTRRFAFPGSHNAPKVGTIENITLFLRYDRSSADVSIEWDESVGPYHIRRGTTKVGLTDIHQNIIAEWNFDYFRVCGRHHRSFSATTSRAIAERVNGVNFRTEGNLQGWRC